MKRNEFLSILEGSLRNMTHTDREDILYDYREHFDTALSEGKTEEEICSSLGDPATLAKQYRVNYIVRQADENRTAGNMLRAVFAALSLGFFNLIIILPVFAGLIAVLLGLYAVAVSLTVSGICVFLGFLLQPVFPWINLPNFNPGIIIFASLGLISMGLLFFIGCVYTTKYFFSITIKYIKANIRIIVK